jgi:hypothetical protein
MERQLGTSRQFTRSGQHQRTWYSPRSCRSTRGGQPLPNQFGDLARHHKGRLRGQTVRKQSARILQPAKDFSKTRGFLREYTEPESYGQKLLKPSFLISTSQKVRVRLSFERGHDERPFRADSSRSQAPDRSAGVAIHCRPSSPRQRRAGAAGKRIEERLGGPLSCRSDGRMDRHLGNVGLNKRKSP